MNEEVPRPEDGELGMEWMRPGPGGRLPPFRRRRTTLACWTIAVWALLLLVPAAQGQSVQAGSAELFETRFVEAGDIRLQYHDFGGSGLPVIFVQDYHDYFGAALDPEWPPFLARFADDFRVLAPVRRGWGESEDTGWGYDVATQSEDLLAFMDALRIQRAVLVGRTPADQDMTWIAEHHPERVAGLVYLQSLHVPPDLGDPLIRQLDENYAAGACDMGQAVAQVGARTPWRPHFLRDETVEIDIPALRFFWPFDDRSMNLRRLDRVADIARRAIVDAESVDAGTDTDCPAAENDPERYRAEILARRDYFVALAADEAWQAELRQALLEKDLLGAVDKAMQRAFGDRLRTVRGDLGDWQAHSDFQYPHIRSFLEEVARMEGGSGPNTSAHDGEVRDVLPRLTPTARPGGIQ